MFAKEAVILAGARTPMTRYSGAFADTSALELGAAAAREAIRRSGVPANEFDHVIIGNVMQTSSDAIYGARHVGLKAGLPVGTPAVTVNRLCGSGMEAISQAAQRVLLGESNVILAGGTENMTQCPHVIRGARVGFRLGEGKLEDSLMSGLFDPMSGCTMSDTAENLAVQYGTTRQACDEFALRSQQLAEAAFRACRMKEEVSPVEVKKGKKTQVVAEDDHRRPDTTLEILASLPPAFRKDGVTTAGNASGIVDGAAAVVITHEKTAKNRGWKPMGRVVSFATVGVEPKIMGIGPAPAIRKALSLAGLKLEQMDLIEVNEAFAAQYLAVEKELGLDRQKVNVNGGAIALGHPLGMSGTRLVLTLLLELRRRNARYGVASACIGGGQGIAMIVESIA
jgi:acetyl-CoA acyltransferase 2